MTPSARAAVELASVLFGYGCAVGFLIDSIGDLLKWRRERCSKQQQ